jgi:hypothetical protein
MLIVIVMGVLYFAAFYKVPEKYTPIQSQKIYDMFTKEDTETDELQSGSLALINYNQINSKREASKIETLIKEQKRIKEGLKQKQIKKIVETINKENLPSTLELNYQSLHKVVSESKKSFFFALQQELSGITVNLVSYTPYNNRGILKIKIENNSQSYFFYSSISLQGAKVQIFGPQFTKTNGSSDIYLLFDPDARKSFTLSIIEQQSKRLFKINFSIP